MDKKDLKKSISSGAVDAEKTDITKTTSIAIIILLILAAMSGLFPSPFAIGGIIVGGIIFGISKYRKKFRYHGYAGAIIALCCLLSLFFYFVMKTTIKQREWRAKNFTIEYNLKTVGNALQKYAENHNGYLPTAENWADLLLQYDKTLTQDNFRHPRTPEMVIAFNENLSGLRLKDVPKDTLLLFETEGTWNASGGEESIRVADPNHSYVNILYVNQILDYYSLEQGGVGSKSFKDLFKNKFVEPRWRP